MPRRGPTSPTSGHSPAICRRAIRTGNWSQPKPGNDRMAALPPRSQLGIGLALGLIAAAGPAAASEMKFRNAQVEPLSFTKMAGWQDDDHAAAFGAYLKSCSAILQGSKAKRAARPVYGGLYRSEEHTSELQSRQYL